MYPLYRVVTYIFRPGAEPTFGLLPGYCIMALRPASALDVMTAREDGRLHHLKTWAPYWDEVCAERKNYELRKDDREPRYEVGDVLELERTVPPAPEAKGEEKACGCGHRQYLHVSANTPSGSGRCEKCPCQQFSKPCPVCRDVGEIQDPRRPRGGG